MSVVSAGVLAYRRGDGGELEVLLGHPGGPLWAHKDLGAWTIPKGILEDGEDERTAAQREFAEEIGSSAPDELVDLGEIRQPSRKIVRVFAGPYELDPATVRSNLFPMEWPPRSGRIQEFPEVDRAEWFSLETARAKIMRGQVGFLDRLWELLGE
jgi:predicted NUDIX family NTP pyrophosphohydrolase